MMVNERKFLTDSYICALKGTDAPSPGEGLDFASIFEMAEAQDVCSALYLAWKESEFVPDEIKQKLQSAYNDNKLLLERNDEEQRKLFAKFEEEKEEYLPLKESLLRRYYSDGSMRGKSATDIMVSKGLKRKAREIVLGQGFVFKGSDSGADVYAKDGDSVVRVYNENEYDAVYTPSLLSKAKQIREIKKRKALNHSDFYVYLVSDFARCLSAGAVSLRSLADVWVFLNRFGDKLDKKRIADSLAELKLTVCDKELKKAIYKLFYDGDAEGTALKLLDFIFATDLSKKEEKTKRDELVSLFSVPDGKSEKEPMSQQVKVTAVFTVVLLVLLTVLFFTLFFQKLTEPKNENSLSQGTDSFSEESFVSENENSDGSQRYYGELAVKGGLYKGYLIDGIPDGPGEISYTNGESYVGGFSEGVFNGVGTYYYLDGSCFDGIWLEGTINGEGTLYNADGSLISGNFIDGVPSGECVYSYANGEIYVGVLVDGKRNGIGRFNWLNGDVYEGNFLNGDRQGQGKYTYSDGSYYEGSWINNRANGYGVFSDESGKRSGFFIEWYLEGEGKYEFSNGDVYEGNFVHNLFSDDEAKLTYSNGDVYVGAFSDGVINGKGKITFANGDIVEGTFKNGKLEGKAKYFYAEHNFWQTVTYKNGSPA
ncbi:MAG: nucleotidyltransferase family protein [Clostridia bacterium]|nr:nucleotidyltransferase family protein [Clostridia bacterium]